MLISAIPSGSVHVPTVKPGSPPRVPARPATVGNGTQRPPRRISRVGPGSASLPPHLWAALPNVIAGRVLTAPEVMGLLASGVSQTPFGRSLAPAFVEAIGHFLGRPDSAGPRASADQVKALWALPPGEWKRAVAPGLLARLDDRVPGFRPWHAAHASLKKAQDDRATAAGEHIGEADRRALAGLVAASEGLSRSPEGDALSPLVDELREMGELPTPASHAMHTLADMSSLLHGIPSGDALRRHVRETRDALAERSRTQAGSHDAAVHDAEMAKAQHHVAVERASHMQACMTPWLSGLLKAAESAQFPTAGAQARRPLNALRTGLYALRALGSPVAREWTPDGATPVPRTDDATKEVIPSQARSTVDPGVGHGLAAGLWNTLGTAAVVLEGMFRIKAMATAMPTTTEAAAMEDRRSDLEAVAPAWATRNPGEWAEWLVHAHKADQLSKKVTVHNATGFALRTLPAELARMFPGVTLDPSTMVMENIDVGFRYGWLSAEVDKARPYLPIAELFLHNFAPDDAYSPYAARVFPAVGAPELVSPADQPRPAKVVVENLSRVDLGARYQAAVSLDVAREAPLLKDILCHSGHMMAIQSHGEDAIDSVTHRELRIAIDAPEASPLKVRPLRFFGDFEASRLAVLTGLDHAVVLLAPDDHVAPMRQFSSVAHLETYLQRQLRVPAFRTALARVVDIERQVDFRERLDETLYGADTMFFGVALRVDGRPLTIELDETRAPCALIDALFGMHQHSEEQQARAFAPSSADRAVGYWKREWAALEDAGIGAVKGFFGPLGVAYDVLRETYTGVDAWMHGDMQKAWQCLESGLVNAAMVGSPMLAEEGLARVVGDGLDPSLIAFRDSFVPVQTRDGIRLWRPDLAPYALDGSILAGLSHDDHGMYLRGDDRYIVADGNTLGVARDETGAWRVAQPNDAHAYQPEVVHNGLGGWRLREENVADWNRKARLERLTPATRDMPAEAIARILDVSDVSEEALLAVHNGEHRMPHQVATEIDRVVLANTLDTLGRESRAWSGADADVVYATAARTPAFDGASLVVWDADGNAQTFGRPGSAVAVHVTADAGRPFESLLAAARRGELGGRFQTLMRRNTERGDLARHFSRTLAQDPGAVADDLGALRLRRLEPAATALMRHFPELTPAAARDIADRMVPSELSRLAAGDIGAVRGPARERVREIREADLRRHLFIGDPASAADVRVLVRGMEKAFPGTAAMSARIEFRVGADVVSMGPSTASEVKTITRQSKGRFLAADAQGRDLNPRHDRRDVWSALMHALPDEDRVQVFGSVALAEGGRTVGQAVAQVVRDHPSIVADEVAVSGSIIEEGGTLCRTARSPVEVPLYSGEYQCFAIGTTSEMRRVRLERLDRLAAAEGERDVLMDGRKLETIKDAGVKRQAAAKVKEVKDLKQALQRNLLEAKFVTPIRARSVPAEIVAPPQMRIVDTPEQFEGETLMANSGKDSLVPWAVPSRSSHFPEFAVAPGTPAGVVPAGLARMGAEGFSFKYAIRREGAYLRAPRVLDTEAKTLEYIDDKIQDYIRRANDAGYDIGAADIEGNILLVSELYPCASCADVIVQFGERYPGMKLSGGFTYIHGPHRDAFFKLYREADAELRDSLKIDLVWPYLPEAIAHPMSAHA